MAYSGCIQRTSEEHVTAIARIYEPNGGLLRYTLHNETLETGDPLPLVVLQTLFPQETFAGSRVVIHHSGPLRRDVRDALARWGQVLDATFCPVDIIRRGVPRLYATDDGVTQPDAGSAFLPGTDEAILVTAVPADGSTPRPLHVRTHDPAALPIESALHSVLTWTLLHYGMERPARLPVTVTYAEELARWLETRRMDDISGGDVPFWL